jgi:hypothetical protein
MGTQQLLMIVIGVILIGVAIAVAIALFQANVVESGRNALIEDLLFLAGKARDYYFRPAALNGGNKSFNGLTSIRMLTVRPENENGRYFIVATPSPHEVVLGGIGKVVIGSDTIEVHMSINEATSVIRIVH